MTVSRLRFRADCTDCAENDVTVPAQRVAPMTPPVA
jgi:hypothetical protein